MTRAEAKDVLIAWKKAAQRVSALSLRKGELIHKLSTIPSLAAGSPESITLTRTENGAPITEPAYAYQPRGNGAGDPTARAAEQRDALRTRLDQTTAELDACEDFYLGVLRAVSGLSAEHLRILHLHYCLGAPGYITPEGKQAYYYRLRCAVSAFQRLDDLPDIPDFLIRKEEF